MTRASCVTVSACGTPGRFSQVTAIGLYILPLSGAGALKLAVLSIAVAITVISGVDYFVAAWKAR